MSIQFGRYELLRKLAAGGMGQVFLARKKGVGFEKLVVLKRILPHLVEDEEFFTMFLDEARLTARLNHPNIAQIFDVEAEAGQHLVVMEYVQGDDVRRVEKKARLANEKLPVGVILRTIADAAAGLDYAHKARDDQGQPLGIVHRDISPQNILVGFDGGVKLIDFGVAKAAGRAQHTATGVLKGKFPYMSPEQAEGEELDARSDVFALGIVLWELLCDKRLFKGDSDVMSQRLVKACQVPRPSELNTQLPPKLDAIVLKSLARNRDERFQSAQELREAIEQYILEAQLPASASHLGAFMQRLYADKIAELNDPTKLDQLSADTDLEGFGPRGAMATPAPSGGTRRGTVTVGGGATIGATRTSHTEQVDRQAPAPAPSRVPIFAAIALLAVGSGGAAAWIVTRPGPQVDPVVKPVVKNDPQPDTPPQVPDKPPAPALVALKVESEPAGAAVEIGGVPRGMTPLDLSFEKTQLPVLLKVSRDGFESQQTTLTAESGPVVSLQLVKKKKSGKALEIKTGR
ncbi:MAG: protein kinase [Myxococcaceae bacterium]|nr:protein kinase [Myxococcaceae bacterium]